MYLQAHPQHGSRPRPTHISGVIMRRSRSGTQKEPRTRLRRRRATMKRRETTSRDLWTWFMTVLLTASSRFHVLFVRASCHHHASVLRQPGAGEVAQGRYSAQSRTLGRKHTYCELLRLKSALAEGTHAVRSLNAVNEEDRVGDDVDHARTARDAGIQTDQPRVATDTHARGVPRRPPSFLEELGNSVTGVGARQPATEQEEGHGARRRTCRTCRFMAVFRWVVALFATPARASARDVHLHLHFHSHQNRDAV
ncbi:hypothetical protein FA95DRAFT_1575809 [Auriscalpium vulgare]|uniref:Uncharacterized protein n=1 Tax=Auriscalpium vulgare TaxID=40419 RepID=A0ACB8REK4_9AGAM|nr:hypothetical protein FA95DRAFT_1575809 [Auriscalpium vulgare]